MTPEQKQMFMQMQMQMGSSQPSAFNGLMGQKKD